jgi:beta-galactosidase
MRRCLAALLLVLAALAPAQTPAKRVRWDAGWKFQREAIQSDTEGTSITDWTWQPAPDNSSDQTPPPQTPGQPAKVNQDVFRGRVGFAWFHTDVTKRLTGGRPWALRFLSVDDNATVWINGRRILHHEVWDDPFDVPIPANWNQTGPNQVDVLVENTAGQGGIYRRVALIQKSPEPAPVAAKAAFNDAKWRTVHLPHDYVIEGKFTPDADTGHGSLPVGPAWYRKHFFVPKSAAGQSVWLEFEGVFSDSTVYLNGYAVGGHRGGYNGFTVDLSRRLKPGQDNVLAVHVDARKFEGWWYEGGGIYRHVWLNVAPKTHIATDGLFAKATVLDPETRESKLKVETTVVNQGRNPVHGIVFHSVTDSSGKVIAAGEGDFTLSPGARGLVSPPEFPVHRPDLWSLESPRLYTLTSRLTVGGKTLDTKSTTFGFRHLRFDPDNGFFLNGKPVKLNGTCNHQDFIGVGTGMPDSVLAWRIKTLKSFGCNAYRTSHNEVAPALLEACDRQGMLVMDENREFGDTYTGKASKNTTARMLGDIRQLVRRDRNHPSIIMWSIANEEPMQGTPTGKMIGETYKRAILGLDDSRPIVAAINYDHGRGLGDVTDLEGFNYSPGQYPSYHAEHPGHPMFGSETASAVETRGEYADDPVRGYVTSYDLRGTDTVERAWEPIGANPYMEGGFVWTGFDYKGEPSPYGWPCVNSHFGIIDMCGFWKDGAWYYLAWWGGKPTVHIFPHWNWPGKEGQPIDVWAYGNGDEVELFLNGQSLGRKPMPKFRHISWSVPYAPGTLMALSYKDGVAVAKDVVTTTGAPAKLRLVTDRTKLNGDNEDITMVRVEVLDAEGRVVPTAAPLIKFSLQPLQATGRPVKMIDSFIPFLDAEIAGVGNGDPSCHEPDQASQRHAFHGLAMVLVRGKYDNVPNQPGKVRLTATAPGLAPATLDLQVLMSRDPLTAWE